ncbi:MAG: hypothetical protein ACLSH6_05600 [Limosilactobacillus pontis]
MTGQNVRQLSDIDLQTGLTEDQTATIVNRRSSHENRRVRTTDEESALKCCLQINRSF